MSCHHPDFVAHVNVGRIVAAGAEESSSTDALHFVADVRVECAACGEALGFRVPDCGVLPDRPTVSVDGREIRLPLLSPAELALAGPLAGMEPPDGPDVPGFRVKRR